MLEDSIHKVIVFLQEGSRGLGGWRLRQSAVEVHALWRSTCHKTESGQTQGWGGSPRWEDVPALCLSVCLLPVTAGKGGEDMVIFSRPLLPDRRSLSGTRRHLQHISCPAQPAKPPACQCSLL